MAAGDRVGSLVGYAPPASRGEAAVRRAVKVAAWHLGVEPLLADSEDALSVLLASRPPGLLLTLDGGDAVREALAAGFVVVSSRRHVDALPGREMFWVMSERPEVLESALLFAARKGRDRLDEMRAAAERLGRSTTPAAFDARWAPPLVSVIMPVYDRAEVVTASVRSVLSQTVADIELVIVDDGSSDGSRDAVAAVADRRIVTRWQCGAGPSHARNAGLGMARSPTYLSFLDSDDLWEPVFLERMLEALAVAPPQVGLVYSDYDHSIDGAPPQPRTVEEASFPTLALSDGLIPTGSFVFRREVLDRVGPLDEGLFRGEDYAWLLRVAAHFELARVPELLFHYRQRRSGQLFTTGRDDQALRRQRMQALSAWSNRVLPERSRF
jgi:GT2 family glycosyltransferase